MTRIAHTIIWLTILGIMAWAWWLNQLTLGGFLLFWFMGLMLTKMFKPQPTLADIAKEAIDKATKTANEKSDELKARREEIERETERDAADLQKRMNDAREAIREEMRKANARFHDQTITPPQADPMEGIVVNRRSIEMLRNVLMMHHNSRASDADYPTSKMGRNTTEVLQSLNGALQRTKSIH